MHPNLKTSSPCLNLISGPSKIITTTIPENARTKTPETPFPIAHLPYELRQLVYESYISALPSINIIERNASSPLNLEHPISQSSPFFISDIPDSTFYQQATFSFSSGEAMKTFSALYSRSQNIRKIKIEYGKDDAPTRDWVYLLSSCFERLEEVHLSVECVQRVDLPWEFGKWWGVVRDAVREGLCARREERGLMLRVEDRNWGVCEVL